VSDEERGPYKFDAERKEAYLAELRKGTRRHAAARAVGISPSTVCLHIRDDEEFRRARDLAEQEANETVEDALYQAALSGNVVACQVWLYNRWPDRWADKRKHEHSGPDGGPVQVQHLAHLSDAELDQIIATDTEDDADGDGGDGGDA
jgi:hypothetical protein